MREIRIGVISDTHGLLRPQAVAVLAGSDLIIHAGDVGDPKIIDDLRTIAPTFAVRGNIDQGAWAAALPMTEPVEAGELRIYVLHDVSASCFSTRAAPARAASSSRSQSRGSGSRTGRCFRRSWNWRCEFPTAPPDQALMG